MCYGDGSLVVSSLVFPLSLLESLVFPEKRACFRPCCCSLEIRDMVCRLLQLLLLLIMILMMMMQLKCIYIVLAGFVLH